MNKKILKVIGIILVFAVVVTVIPDIISLANKQNPVKRLLVEKLTSTTYTNPFSNKKTVTPNVKLVWEADSPSLEEDKTDGVQEGNTPHTPSRFKVMYKNISSNEQEKLLTVLNGDSYEIKSGLSTGTIYRFSVLPVHDHRYGTPPDQVTKEAPYTDADHPYVLVLTDLEVEVETIGKQIKITFDNAGSWIDYDIYYEQGEVTSFTAQSARIQSVRNMCSQIIDPVTKKAKLVYILDNPSIKSGQIYSITVKPLYAQIDGVEVLSNQETNISTCTTEVPLSVKEESENYIRLNWWGIDTTIGVGSTAEQYNVKELYIVEKNEETKAERTVANLVGERSINVGYYVLQKPKVASSYKLVIVYSKISGTGTEETKEMESKYVPYDPTSIRITPTKPELPDANKKLSMDDNNILDLSKYIGTFRYDDVKNAINLVWSSFESKDYAGNLSTIIDLDVYYDILVTDDVNILSNAELNTEENYYVGPNGDKSKLITDKNGKMIGYHKEVSEYLAAVMDNGIIRGYAVKPLEYNKVYYIRIIAKKIVNGEELLSVPAITAIYIDVKGNIHIPPVLPKPPLFQKAVTDTTVTVGFTKSWYEVTEVNNISDWSSRVWVVNGDISFTKVDGAEEFTLLSVTDVNVLKSKIDSSNIDKYAFRQIQFEDDTKYEAYIIKNVEIEKELQRKRAMDPTYTMEDFILEFNSRTENDILYEAVVPVEDKDDKTGNSLVVAFNGLDNNTGYFIMMRAYREQKDGSKIYNAYPSSIVLTTLLPGEEIEPVPTVPSLSLDSALDIQADIMWKYNSLLSYEVRVSSNEDINGAISMTVSKEMLNDPNANKKGENYVLTLYDLFPNSQYYVFIKAKQNVGKLESAWSNALVINTTDIRPSPLNPPGGIGIASIPEPIGKDYISLEWLRTQEDIDLDSYKGTKIKKKFTYILEIADNIKFLDSKIVEVDGEKLTSTSDFDVISRTIVKAKGLRTNVRYYIRLKSRVTVTEQGTSKTLSKDSPWSIVKIIKTLAQDEYDSEVGGIEVPLEEKVEKTTKGNTLTYRILNDERVINDLIKRNSFDYVIDLSDEKSSILYRNIIIPDNVLSLMQSRYINIVIKISDLTVSIPAKAFMNADYKELKRNGEVKELVISVNDGSYSYGSYLRSKDVTAVFKTAHGTKETTYLEDYVSGNWNVSSFVYYGSDSLKALWYNENNKTWDVVKDQSEFSGNLVFKVGKLGRYAIGR